MDVSQTVVTALKTIRETLVVEPEQMQDCGVQVVDMYRILCDVEAQFVGGTIRDSAFDTATREPH